PQPDHKRAVAYSPACHAILWPMPGLFDYHPHPHMEQRKLAGPPTVVAAIAKVHGPGLIGRLNAKVGLKITLVVGTMWAAYVFTLLALVSAPSAFSSGNK